MCRAKQSAVCLLALIFALLCSQFSAWAFYQEGTCSSARANGTAVSTSMPTGTFNVGDVLVLVATATTTTSDITVTGGTGSWTLYPGTGADAGNNYTWTTNGHMIVATHVYANGDTAPTLNATGATPQFSWMICPYWGTDTVTPIEAMKATTTSASATVSFPSITPSNANDELFLFGAGKFGAAPTYSSIATTTTGANCTGGGNTTDLVFVNSMATSSPDLAWYQQNQGPCSPAATSGASIVASSSGDNIGVAVLLKSAALATAPPRRLPLISNLAGVYDFNALSQARTSIDPADSEPFVDGVTAYINWINLEPNNCDEYTFDWLDNAILNARVLGKKVTISVTSGFSTPCGGTNEAPCSGFNDLSATPAWAYTSTVCDGSAVPPVVNSMWTKPTRGPTQGSLQKLLEPGDSAYQAELDRAITDFGHRWGWISNISGVYVPGLSVQNSIISLNNGTDGGAVVCNGTASQCQAVVNLSAWQSAHSYALNTKIIPNSGPTISSGGVTSPAYFQVTACTGGCPQNSGGSEPNWSASCATANSTCTDGVLTWTNEGQSNRVLADAAQWLAITPSGGGSFIQQTSSNSGNSCGGGSNTQPWSKCYMEPAYEHFESTVRTAFPNAVAMNGRNAGQQDPNGAAASPGFFQPDMFTYNGNNYAGVSLELDSSLGCNSSCSSPTAPYIQSPHTIQPSNGIGYQEIAPQEDVTGGAVCNNGFGGYAYSISTTNCVPIAVYSLLTASMFPYVEVYRADLDDTSSQPWWILLHQLVAK